MPTGKYIRTKQRDATKDLFFKMYGYKIFRFTDKEINKSPKNCINKVLKQIYNKP
jgi:very-short-patch-repair endonuclease